MSLAQASPLKLNSLSYCSNRLQTFKGWPYRNAPSPHALSLAGFCWTGDNTDGVFCPFCHVKLHSWKAEDEPLLQHHKFSPTCEYVLLCFVPTSHCSCCSPYANARRTFAATQSSAVPSSAGWYESDGGAVDSSSESQ